MESHRFWRFRFGIKQKLGRSLRWLFLRWNSVRGRWSGVDYRKQFRAELIISRERGDAPSAVRCTVPTEA
jgi:hypothetical protein